MCYKIPPFKLYDLMGFSIFRIAQLSLLILKHFRHLIKKVHAIGSHSHSLSPSHWQSLIYFLSPWICLFQTFHVNGFIQHVAFPLAPCFKGSSMLQQIVLHFFLWLNNIP